MSDQNDLIHSTIIQYAESQMNSEYVTVKEYKQLQQLVATIINQYYPSWDDLING